MDQPFPTNKKITKDDIAKALIKRQEGLRLTPYQDTEGILTIGWGRNLEKGITQEEAEFLFIMDYYQAREDLIRLCPEWKDWDDRIFAGLVSMMYNLGLPRFLTFTRMIDAAKAGDWRRVAAEMRDSKWRRQVPNRVEEIAGLIEAGAA